MAIKVIEDTMKNAGAVLSETDELLDHLMEAWPWVQPSNSSNAIQAGGPAKYIVACRVNLQKLGLAGFDRTYPAISLAVSSGNGSDDSNARLVDGIFQIGKLNMLLEENKCMLKTDDQRNQARAMLKTAIGDFAIFLLSQYKLGRADDEIYLSVNEYCARGGITSSVLYGNILNTLEIVGEQPYGYEEISPYYDDLVGIDPGFLAECQEARYPLTEERCQSIIDGSMPLEVARGLLTEFQKNIVDVDMDGINPNNMIQRMHLST